MGSGTTTFDEVERSADRTFAYALLAKAAQGYVIAVLRLAELNSALDQLLKTLKPCQIDSLRSEQKQWLGCRLPEIHSLLALISGSEEAEAIGKLPILASLITRLRDSTEDMGDIIEDVLLINDETFGTLIRDCATSIHLSE